MEEKKRPRKTLFNVIHHWYQQRTSLNCSCTRQEKQRMVQCINFTLLSLTVPTAVTVVEIAQIATQCRPGWQWSRASRSVDLCICFSYPLPCFSSGPTSVDADIITLVLGTELLELWVHNSYVVLRLDSLPTGCSRIASRADRVPQRLLRLPVAFTMS